LKAYLAVLDDARRHEMSIGQIVKASFDEVITEIMQQNFATALDADAASPLDTTPGEPALGLHRWYLAKRGQAFEYMVDVYPADRFSINLRLRRA